ncbi:MAG TPA: DNA-J related domain-containing protein [Cellvibrionaceae bacterium]
MYPSLGFPDSLLLYAASLFAVVIVSGTGLGVLMSALLAALRQRLNRPGLVVAEHTLIKELSAEGLLPGSLHQGPLALFQTHFVLSNALYRLNDSIASEGLVLDIGLVDIRVRKLIDAEQSALSQGGQARLRDYYLDWSNLHDASEDSVNQLLDDFWQNIGRAPVAASEKQQALDTLSLTEPVTFTEIKMRYRRLVMREHPDRGGDTATLQNLNDAMAVLARAYDKTP